jgi:hypothetical protein
MSNTIRNAKQFGSIQDTVAERWSRLYVDVRASYGRAAIQAALLLNGAASVALLAFLGNLAIAQQTKGLAGNFVTFNEAFVCFGIGVMLAASSSVVAFLIQNVAIARPRKPKAGPVVGSDRSESEWSSRRFSFLRLDSPWLPTH